MTNSNDLPAARRINPRLITVLLAVFSLASFGVYRFAKAQMSHGVEKDGNIFRVDLKALGRFQFDPYTGTIDNVPPQFRPLDGQEVALEGFAYVGNNAGSDANEYEFVYNIQKCCLGGPPQMQERVFAKVKDLSVAPLLDGEFRIFGKLHINTKRDEIGKIEKLYTIDVEHSEPL